MLSASLLAVRGCWEQVDGVAHLIAQEIQDLSDMLNGLCTTLLGFSLMPAAAFSLDLFAGAMTQVVGDAQGDIRDWSRFVDAGF